MGEEEKWSCDIGNRVRVVRAVMKMKGEYDDRCPRVLEAAEGAESEPTRATAGAPVDSRRIGLGPVATAAR